MSLIFNPLHPTFVAELNDVDLTDIRDDSIFQDIRRGMDEYGVLIVRNQFFDDDSQLAFAKGFDGKLHTKTGIAAIARNRFGNEALTDVANVDQDGQVLAADDRKRQYALANRLWHTDASFEDPPGRYSMLSARVLPENGPDTEFADTRTAYDELPAEMKPGLEDLQVHHSIAYSREQLGFEFLPEEAERLAGVIQPLIRTNPATGRKALYIAAHCSRIVDWPVPDGRLLLRELIEHATQPQFVYAHQWREGDLVIYDNRATMHRARPFEDTRYRRELRRITSLDV